MKSASDVTTNVQTCSIRVVHLVSFLCDQLLTSGRKKRDSRGGLLEPVLDARDRLLAADARHSSGVSSLSSPIAIAALMRKPRERNPPAAS